jgi:hypothetical protein
MKIHKTKPLGLGGQGLRVQRLKSFCNAPIIGHFKPIRQALPTKNDRLTKLIGKVRDKRLTESLELLEQSGFTGDLALFILGEIQEVWA